MGLRNRIAAALAQDGKPDPQARDEQFDPFGTALDVDRATPDAGDIDDWTDEYQENILIRKPTQTFTSDVLEPGYRVDLGLSADDGPQTVSTEHPNEDLRGEDLDDALERWLESAGIVDGEFHRDFEDVLEKAIKDEVGRRGTAMVEVVYDDRREQDRIMAFRPFKVETVTAYTREGKSILLRPDDTPSDSEEHSGFEATLPGRRADGSRRELPQTPGGDTACYVQYDDVIGSWDRDEVRFAQDDVVKLAYDADTGDVFGTPDTASVYDRANSIRKQYKDLDQALKAVAYQHWIATVETSDQEEAKELLSGFDPSNPEKVNVVNYAVETKSIGGELPDIDSTLKQEIEYVLSAFPVPIYRIGFEGDINRDVTSEQSDDYQRELSDWRDDIAAAFADVLKRKAAELVDGDLEATPRLVIAPRESDNPLEDENFDAEAFSTTMQGVQAIAGPGQSPSTILPPETVLETFLGLDADEVLGDDQADDEMADLSPLDEADPRVQETFTDMYAAELAAFAEGDAVDTPDGTGVVVDVVTDGTIDEMDATSDDPVYVVAFLRETGYEFFRAGDLDEGELPDGGPDDPDAALAEFEVESALADSEFDYPKSWRASDTPNRIILLKAWAGMGGTFRGCRSEGLSRRLCASMKDKVLGTESWCGGWA